MQVKKQALDNVRQYLLEKKKEIDSKIRVNKRAINGMAKEQALLKRSRAIIERIANDLV